MLFLLQLNKIISVENNIIACLDVDVVPDVEQQDELLEENPFSDVDEVEEEEELEVDEEAVQCFLEVGERLVLQ